MGAEPAIEEATALLAILGMAGVTYLSRIGGIWAMALVPITPRVEATLKALSGSVLVALVVPATLQGGRDFAVAVGLAVVLMAFTGRTLLALTCGVTAAALLRWVS